MGRFSDHELGMGRRIKRRDFLNGMAIGAGGVVAAAALPGLTGTAAANTYAGGGNGYPPSTTGLRGQQAGSFDVGHAVRDGSFDPGQIRDTGEDYDLVVVGGGISGLATAWFYRQAFGRDARILVLEALDDFGGHARRNEFQVRGETMLSNGGTVNIDSPSTFSRQALGLLQDIGIDLDRLGRVTESGFYPSLGLKSGYFFNSERYGTDQLVIRDTGESWTSIAARLPLSDKGKSDVARVYTAQEDYLPGLDDAQKKDVLARISYERYLREKAGVGDEAIEFLQRGTSGLWGVNIGAVSAGDAWAVGQPGFAGLKLAPTPFPGIGRTPRMELEATDEDYYYFPDGNASVARLLVSQLVPKVFDNEDMEHIVTAKAKYGHLDAPNERIRIRLRSTAVNVLHTGAPGGSRGVAVVYSQDGKSYRVQARHAVMACWNSVSSYIVDGLPAEQVAAMRYGAKVPLLYARVALRNWQPFVDLGVSRVTTPSMYWNSFGLNPATRLGAYESPRDPAQPNIVTLSKTPNKPGLPARAQHRAGRGELIRTPFETFEREIRDVMARALGPGGFDPARDITAITVNRWAHGYAYEYNSLDDPAIFLPEEQQPFAIARRRFGRIAIANSDAGAFAYTHGAIDQAYRAVNDLMEA
ncbi:NAD(P)-binding protein [Microtetraspora sp. NBRC 16547]|uniref:NAD(P)-binding protein n=1 Tax=Microtetraspora sp. NBRC 16547 TaxID=3030993 RepID=UPI0024A5904A|nr:NAD(P)-binding protein [Microtetraspora sp. NBRC 16547]GLW99082.1 spermidine dehydrogenase SpdH [Microtetraspora sp. NBRC 16547]